MRVRGDGVTTLMFRNFRPNQVQVLDGCIEKTLNDQYTLVLRDSISDSWDEGSMVDVRNDYGVSVFNGRMTATFQESIPLSLYAPITPLTAWQFSLNAPQADWTEVSAIVDGWDEYIKGNWTESASGTQYFRTSVRVMTNLAAYDLRVRYISGVIIYVNGIEVYRDNMADGLVDATTLATNSYNSEVVRGVVRSGMDLLNPTAVIAVELHFTSNESREVTFEAILSQMASASVNSNCYMLSEYSVTSPHGSTSDLTDMNMNTVFSTTSDLMSVSYSWSDLRVIVNGWKFGVGSDTTIAPTSFMWSGSMSSGSEMTEVGSISMSGYNAKTYYTTNSVSSDATYGYYTIQMGSSGSSIGLSGLYPMICSQMVPSSIEYPKNSYSIMRGVEVVSIVPGVSGFVNCSSTPVLPDGLRLSSDCRIEGTSFVTGTNEYTVSGWIMEQIVSSVISISIETCVGTVISIHREGGVEGEGVSIRSSTSSVFHSTAEGSWDETLCLPLGQYTIVMTSSGSAWAPSSSLSVYSLIGLSDSVLIANVHLDPAGGAESSVPLSLLFPIEVGSNWKYNDLGVDWKENDGESWSESTGGQFPITSRIQTYKKMISLSESLANEGMELSVRYQHGCVVLVNGEEVFRDGVNGVISSSSIPSHSYDSVMPHVITLSGSVFMSGTNVITIVLVNTAEGESTFNGVMRVVGNGESRLLDHSVTTSGMSVEGDLTSGRSGIRVSGNCESNEIVISFSNHFESIQKIELFYDSNEYSYPSSLQIEGRRTSNDSWNTLMSVGWMNREVDVNMGEIVIGSPSPYGMYRLSNLSSDECEWILTGLNLKMSSLPTSVTPLSYPPLSTSQFLDVSVSPVTAIGYTEFALNGNVPNGLKIDSVSGVISGVIRVSGSISIGVSAIRITDGERVFTVCEMNVSVCNGSVIGVTVMSDVDVNVSIMRGEEEIVSYNDVRYGLRAVTHHVCVSYDTYRLRIVSVNGIPSPLSSMYAITMMEEELDLSRGVISSNDMSVEFCSLDPIASNVNGWKMSESVSEGWMNESFDDASWSVLNDDVIPKTTTSYLRRVLSVSDVNAYPVLNLRMRYNGGVIVYLNGLKVGRFNLPSSVNHSTSPLSNEEVESNFHILLSSTGHSGDNVLCIEFHHGSASSSVLSLNGGLSMGEVAVVSDSWNDDGSVANLEGSLFNVVMIVPSNSGSLEYSLTANVNDLSGVIGSVNESVNGPISMDVVMIPGATFTSSSSIPLSMTIYGFNRNVISSGMWLDESGNTVISGLSRLSSGSHELHQDVILSRIAENALIEVDISCDNCEVSVSINNHLIESFGSNAVKKVFVSTMLDHYVSGLNTISVSISSVADESVFSGSIRYVASHTRLMDGSATITPNPLGPVSYLTDNDVSTTVVVRNTCVGTVIEWSYADGVKVPVNEYWMTNGNTCNIYAPSGWKVYGKEGNDWIMLQEIEETAFTAYTQTKTFNFPNTVGYSSLKLEVTSCTNRPLSIREEECLGSSFEIAELGFSAKASEGYCVRDGEYGPVASGEVSSIDCPPLYSGTISRECVNGIFGDPVRNCSAIAPTVSLSVTEFSGVMGRSISPIEPEIVGVEYVVSIDPSLPTGLSVDSETGVISGIPIVASPVTSYTLTVMNEGGSDFVTFTLMIEQNPMNCEADGDSPAVDNGEISSIGCPEYYEGTIERLCTNGVLGEPVNHCSPSMPSIVLEVSEYVVVTNRAITPIEPVIAGAEYSVSITPSLPPGLSVDSETGVISGTPSVVTEATTYTLTVTNAAGSNSASILITVNQGPIDCEADGDYPAVEDGATSSIACPEYYTGTIERLCSAGVLGDPVNNCIPSIPTISLPTNSFTFYTYETIEPIVPVIVGVEYTVRVEPSLPAGLTCDNATGIISGTPTEARDLVFYRIFVENEGGEARGSFSLTVVLVERDCEADGDYPAASSGSTSSIACPPLYSGSITRLCYDGTFGEPVNNCNPSEPASVVISPSEITAVTNRAIEPIVPMIEAAEYIVSVSPSLPTGLNLDSETGVISGIPSVVTPMTTYTLTVTNVGGSKTASFSLTIEQGPIDCEADGDFYAVEDGQTSSIACPEYYTGTIDRLCTHGVFGEPVDNCVVITPSISLSIDEYSFTETYEIEPIVPLIFAAEYTVSVSPDLPLGLFLNETTGVISGTPEVTLSSSTFTLTVTNAAGSATVPFVMQIVVATRDCDATDSLPETADGATVATSCDEGEEGYKIMKCVYGEFTLIQSSCTPRQPLFLYGVSSLSLKVGQTITPLILVTDLTDLDITITPSLPQGLTISSDGVISGSPSAPLELTTFTIASGDVSTHLDLTVSVVTCPAIDSFSETVSGSSAIVSDMCPEGEQGTVSRSCEDGVWSSAIRSCTPIPPSSLSYSMSSILAQVGVPISILTPSVSGTVSSFSVSPSLPSGLSLSQDGVLSGVPTQIQTAQTYTIRAEYASSSTSFTITITVSAADCGDVLNGSEQSLPCPDGYEGSIRRMCTNGVLGESMNQCSPVQPSSLSYPSFNGVLTLNAEFTSPYPSVNGLNVTYSITPELPNGLSLNQDTGLISGKGEVLSDSTTYTVSASNIGGSTETVISLSVVKAICEKTSDLEATSVDEEVSVVCGVKGTSVYKCVLSSDGVNAEWSVPDEWCETRSVKIEIVIGICLLVLGVIIGIVALILFFVMGKKTLPVKDKPEVKPPVPATTDPEAAKI